MEMKEPSPPTPLFIVEHDALWHGPALWPVQVGCVSFPTSPCRAEEEAALMMCKHCLAIAKTLLCYQPWFSC